MTLLRGRVQGGKGDSSSRPLRAELGLCDGASVDFELLENRDGSRRSSGDWRQPSVRMPGNER